MSLLASWLASPAPDAAIEISPEAVAIAVLGSRGGSPTLQNHAVEPLPPGAVAPSLIGHNIVDRLAVAAALRAVCDRAGTRPRRAALVIPDLAARVSLVRFDQVPARGEDLAQLIRWQLRKTAPFPVEEGVVTYARGSATEFVVVMARHDIVREYESVCDDVGIQAGLVDLATLSVLNLFLSGDAVPAGDWLLVHMRPTYTSIAIMRDRDLIFFRSRAEGDADALEDVVHQTTMYYQDRLSGQGFSKVLLGGAGRVAGALEAARVDLEARLGAPVESIDPTRAAPLSDRITAAPGLSATLAPIVGMLLRSRREAVSA